MNKFQQTRQVIKYSSKYIKGRTLDLGAGRAKYKSIISQFCSEYITFDIVSGQEVDVVGDILSTPFENESFDTVICTMVFEHIPKPWLAAKEIKRILKKGGVAIISAPFIQSYHQDPGDYFRYTPEGLRSLFDEFKIIKTDYYGEFFTTMAGFIKMHFFNPYKGKNTGRVIRLIERIAGFLDKFVKSNITYIGTYVIAKK